MNRAQIVCSGCQTALVYQVGASNVRCALCQTVTPVNHAQIVCGNCRTTLVYARGAPRVQCSICHVVNTVMAFITCQQCRTTLQYQAGAQSVRCAVCHNVTHVNSGQHQSKIKGPGHGGNDEMAGKEAVVISNPPIEDENGNLTPSILIGVQE